MGGLIQAKGAIIAAGGSALQDLGKKIAGDGKGGNTGGNISKITFLVSRGIKVALTPNWFPVLAGSGGYGPPTSTNFGGPKPSTEYGGAIGSGSGGGNNGPIGGGNSGPVVGISDGYGVPLAPVVGANGGSDGYGAPGPNGWGPSSAVGPAVGPAVYDEESAPALGGYGVGTVEEVDIAGLGNPRGNFASGSSSSAAAVSAGDSYGAPLADPIGAGSTAPIDEYGAPAGPILTDSSSPPEATAPIDEYGAPAAPVQDTYPAASAAEPASDSYGAPVADVLPAPSSPVGDSYGAPTSDVLPAPSAPVGDSYGAPTSDILPASSSAEVVAADSGYGAPAEAPLIQVAVRIF